MLLVEAPIEYRDHLIHLSIDGSEVYTIVNPEHKKLTAATWPELRVMIDEELAGG